MHPWDSDGLWHKAKMFIDKANEFDQASSDFAFWCALSLECLARSALTKVHPALNADPQSPENLLHAFGYELVANPRSLPAHSVFLRLEKIVINFGKPQRELCDFMALLRNAHLHTADLPYENLKPTKWLPRFYDSTKIILGFFGKELSDFIGAEEAKSANELIKSLSNEIAGLVKKRIASHNHVFQARSSEERNALMQAAAAAANSLGNAEVARACPACDSQGILSGTRIKVFPEKYEDGQLLMDVQYLASGFKCTACGLSLKGVEEVSHGDLDIHFIETESTSLHELYEPEHYFEYNMYREGNRLTVPLL